MSFSSGETQNRDLEAPSGRRLTTKVSCVFFSRKKNLLFLKKKKQKDFNSWCCYTSRDCVTEAAMNPEKSGWGAKGFDFSSG